MTGADGMAETPERGVYLLRTWSAGRQRARNAAGRLPDTVSFCAHVDAAFRAGSETRDKSSRPCGLVPSRDRVPRRPSVRALERSTRDQWRVQDSGGCRADGDDTA